MHPNPTPTPDGDPYVPVVTVQCELGNCRRCRGRVISLLAPTGQPCTHDCHDGPTTDPDPAPLPVAS
jgi:hypothetical protein